MVSATPITGKARRARVLLACENASAAAVLNLQRALEYTPMILEMARIQIDPARKSEFLAAVAQAAPLFQAAAGCRSMRIAPVVEHAAQFMLLVEWETLADHMEGFRNSAAFQQWRALAGPFFVAPPVVEHAETGPSFF